MSLTNINHFDFLELFSEASNLFEKPYTEEMWNDLLIDLESKVSHELLPYIKNMLFNIKSLKEKAAGLSFTAKTLELFQQINKEISALAPLDTILQLSAGRLRDISKADLVLIGLTNKCQDQLQIQVVSGTGFDQLLHYNQSLKDGIASWLMKNKEPFLIPDFEKTDRSLDPIIRILEEEGFRSLLGAPLLINGEMIGVIYSARKYPYPSSELLINMLTTYCAQIAVAISNARLYANELRISALSRNIFEAALNQGYEGMVQKLSDFINESILLMDEFGNTICSVIKNDSKHPFPLYIYEDILYHSKSDDSKVVLHLENTLCTVFPILLHERTVAYIIIPKNFNLHDDLDIMAIEQSKNVLALKISQERTKTEVELRLRQDYLYDLILGLESEEDLIRRGRYLKIDFKNPHQIIILTPTNIHDSNELKNKQSIHNLERIRNRLGFSLLPLSMVNGEKLIVVTPAHQTNNIAKTILSSFKEYSLSNATIGVSNIALQPRDYSKGYEEAKRAAEFAEQLGRKGEIVHFNDLGILGILFEAKNFESMKDYCDRYLGTLIEYDNANKKELIHSLQVYLDNESVIQAAAEQLHVHYNTLRYRINRIEEITGLNLTNPQHKLNFRISLMIYNLIKSRQVNESRP